MKAVTFNPDNNQFSINEINIPTIQSHEILIKVEACGINPVDAKVQFWKGMVGKQMNDEWVVGLDVVGKVHEVGSEVMGFDIGDEVFYHGNMIKPHGGLAEYAVHTPSTLFKRPTSLSIEDAAASPCAGWTAWRALVEKLQVNERDELLIIGGSGGVGSYAIQIAKNVFNVKKVIAVASKANHDYVLSLGADEVIDYKTEDVLRRVQELTNDIGASKAFDTIGAGNDILAANSLRFNGQMLELVDTVKPINYDNVFMKNLTFHQLALGAGHEFGKIGEQSIIDAANGLTKAILNGQIKTPHLQIVNFEGAVKTLNAILEKKVVGKVILKINA
ncbi:zinc-binding dehydrogenase [Flammeovirga sp. SubArs3]|uniref:zinc-binding dehydrogenase n=1 Tax=Flammeovirga sp. SubArs3 TaxID=2995316 RepID=UPI00248C7DC0|nr:zinc-binding dehydrogenase [Flammeovirga sp. SubArs3]